MSSHVATPPAVPCALQTLLALAAADPALTTALLDDRAAVVRASGLTLSATEQETLERIPGATLGRMIAAVGPTLPDPQRRRLLELGAATLAGLAAGALVSESPASGRPFVYQPITEPVEHRPTRGIRPSYPEVHVLRVKTGGGLGEAVAALAIRRCSTELVQAYRRAVLANQRNASAELEATLGVSPAGAVMAVTGVKSRPDEKVFRELVAAALRRAVFPRRLSGEATVTVWLRFVPR